MSEKLGEAPAPLGAPEVEIDPHETGIATGRPRLGGLARPVTFTPAEEAVINAVADVLIPPGEGFPAPSEVGIVDFVGRYLTPTGANTPYYPFAAEVEFKAGLAALGDGFLVADPQTRIRRVAEFERDNEAFFGQLRSLVYYGYYAAAEVTLAIRRHIPAGRDYHGPPLPYGYLHCIESWDEETLATCGRGGYIATDEVSRVDLAPLAWLRRADSDTSLTNA